MSDNKAQFKRSVVTAALFVIMGLLIRDKASFGLAAGTMLGAIIHWFLHSWRIRRKSAFSTEKPETGH